MSSLPHHRHPPRHPRLLPLRNSSRLAIVALASSSSSSLDSSSSDDDDAPIVLRCEIAPTGLPPPLYLHPLLPLSLRCPVRILWRLLRPFLRQTDLETSRVDVAPVVPNVFQTCISISNITNHTK